MKTGYVRLGNKRRAAPGKPGSGETAVDIDRRNPVLGNPYVLHEIATWPRAPTSSSAIAPIRGRHPLRRPHGRSDRNAR